MQPGQLYIRVGVLIVAGIALAIALILFLSGNQITHGRLFETYFSESVQGLEVGAPVKYRGVTIGRVTDLGLVSAEYGGQKPLDIKSRAARLVFVRFQVDTSRIGAVPDTATAVSLGLRTRLASQGLTGITYVEVDFADPARYPALQVPWEPTAEYIPSMPSTLTQVQDAAQKLLAMLDRVDLERLVGELSGLLTDLRRELANGDIHTTLNQTTALLRSLDDAVRAADLPSVTGDIKRTSTALRDTVQSEATQKLLTNAAQAAERLNNAAARLPALIAALQATTQRAGNSTADVEQGLGPLLRDLRAASESLREMTESLRRYPGSVLSAPPPREREPAR